MRNPRLFKALLNFAAPGPHLRAEPVDNEILNWLFGLIQHVAKDFAEIHSAHIKPAQLLNCQGGARIGRMPAGKLPARLKLRLFLEHPGEFAIIGAIIPSAHNAPAQDAAAAHRFLVMGGARAHIGPHLFFNAAAGIPAAFIAAADDAIIAAPHLTSAKNLRLGWPNNPFRADQGYRLAQKIPWI